MLPNSTIEEISDESGSSEYLFVLPVIAVFGLTGNIISLVTIFHSRLRHVNANVYLIVLTSADSVFLIGILLVWMKLDWIAFEYCVGLEYVLMTSSYVSSWSTAALTIERYLAIAHPLRHVRYGHVDRVRMVMYWIPIPFLLQFFQFFSLMPTPEGIPDRACTLKTAHFQILFQALDTLLCYILPCGIIVVLNTLVALKIKKSSTSFGCEELAAQTCLTRRQGGNNQAGTWTRILWVMPLVFVVLNTPFYVFMMIEVFNQVIPSENIGDERSQTFKILFNVAHYMYYMNTSIDVVVYAFSSANFRKTAVIAWKRIFPCRRYTEASKAKVVVSDQISSRVSASYRMSLRDRDRRTSSITQKTPLVNTQVHFVDSTVL